MCSQMTHQHNCENTFQVPVYITSVRLWVILLHHLYLHITLFHFVDASSCRISHILSALSLLFPPFLFFFSSSSIIQRWQLLLSFGSSDPGMLWPSLASLWLPGHGAACSPGPSFAYNSRCGRYYICSVSSEGYKDSGSALQFSPARFTLKKRNGVFTFQIPLHHAHLMLQYYFLTGSFGYRG